MSNHPGMVVLNSHRRNVCDILSKAFPLAFQPEIKTNGLKVSNIFLFDENVFNKDENLASYPPRTPDALNSQINLATCT